MKFNRKHSALYHPIVAVLALLLVLGSGIYAWIYGDVTPSITGEKIRVGDNSGVVFKVDTAEGVNTLSVVSLNKYLDIHTNGLRLRECSTANPADDHSFYTRNTGIFIEEDGNPAGDTEIMTFQESVKNEDYLELNLSMNMEYANPDSTYYVYFLTGSLGNESGYQTGFSQPDPEKLDYGENAIRAEGLKALRVYLQVDHAESYGPAMAGGAGAVFANEKETAADTRTRAIESVSTVRLKMESQDVGERMTAGTYYANYLHENGETTPYEWGSFREMTTNSFAEFSIDAAHGLTGETANANENYLFTFDTSQPTVEMLIRVWLEGGSEYCINQNITPQDLVDLNLYFVVYEVKAAAAP